MRAMRQLAIWFLHRAATGMLMVVVVSGIARAASLDDLLDRTSKKVSDFVIQFSDVKCIEQVHQEKLGIDGKVELKQDSTYDYLVILTNPGGELSLDESRLAVQAAKPDKKSRSMLVTNGFATLFLIFHPYYLHSFLFKAAGNEVIDGQALSRIDFQHVKGTRSPAVLALRGKEYPLEISGSAWIDPASGAIVRIDVGVGSSMEDVGLKTLTSQIEYAAVPFRDLKETFWFPARASVEVETPKQHWRNIHRFSDYKKFSVSTEEQVANK